MGLPAPDPASHELLDASAALDRAAVASGDVAGPITGVARLGQVVGDLVETLREDLAHLGRDPGDTPIPGSPRLARVQLDGVTQLNGPSGGPRLRPRTLGTGAGPLPLRPHRLLRHPRTRRGMDLPSPRRRPRPFRSRTPQQPRGPTMSRCQGRPKGRPAGTEATRRPLTTTATTSKHNENRPPAKARLTSHRTVRSAAQAPYSVRALPVWVCPSRPSWRGAPGRRRWSRWSARSEARTYDLDQPEGRCRLGMGRLTAAWGRPALPGCSTNVMSSATTIVIWVSPVGVGTPSRRCYKAV